MKRFGSAAWNGSLREGKVCVGASELDPVGFS
jgi:hypothetical protein